MSIDKYLYEIIDNYKSVSSEEEKAEIFEDFCSSLWSSKNKRRTYIKTIRFKIREDLLESEIGQIFNAWSIVEYVGYKSMTKDTDWCSLIRQKINNLYTRYCDKNVILKKDYMDLLRTPNKLYYRWINGEEINCNDLTNVIENSIYKAFELKSVYQKQKINLSWPEYKKVIEERLRKIFDRCQLIDDYEAKNLTNEKLNLTNKYIYDFYNEDNFYIKYICNSLEGEMFKYQKEDAGLYVPSSRQKKQYKNCKECGKLIEIKSKKDHSTRYCKECKREKTLEKHIKYNKKRNKKK